MRIFTYPSPFEINRNPELWRVVTRHPHFCASDTLVQGLEAEYGRGNFGILRTVNALLESVFGPFLNNPANDIQLFLTVSGLIRNPSRIEKLKDIATKAAFRFNIGDVVESIRFLMTLGCEGKNFHGECTEEQEILLELYENALKSGAAEPLNRCLQIDKSGFIRAARCTINDEIAYLFSGELGNTRLTTPEQGLTVLDNIINHLSQKLGSAPENPFENTSGTDKILLERARHLRMLLSDEDDTVFDRIIVHGVHRITPPMYALFRLLERIGVEVIFLINYAENLPEVYRTWREVYAWCDTRFEYLAPVNLPGGNEVGRAIASVLEGKGLTPQHDKEVTIFSNLTSFTDWEVRDTFKRAQKKLSAMRTQYYAVRGESSNEILKMYFPEQFNQKPFLSYPIGQFILGVYQMWDFEQATLIMNERSLSECAVAGLFKGDGCTNLLEILRKTRLYFGDVETVDAYLARIRELQNALGVVSSNRRYAPLGKLSFLNVTADQMEQLRLFVEFLRDVAGKLFSSSGPNVDFSRHFKTLMDIVSEPALSGKTLTTTEKELIGEITQRLDAYAQNRVQGNIEDVKDALRFFLAASKKDDSSNWIVRDFEQIDGAVLLSRNTKARDYHFALLSNAHMTGRNRDLLPWPLTEEFFTGYTDVESAVPVITKGLLERRAFLKFSLFYGAFFTKKGVKLSYIREENGEEQAPYYLLDVLGFQMNPYREGGPPSFRMDEDEEAPAVFTCSGYSTEEQEIFSICPYKFTQRRVLQAPIEYSNDFHAKYFVENFMYFFILDNHDLRREEKDAVLEREIAALRRLFPFWDDIVFHDIQEGTSKQLDAVDISRPQSAQSRERYKRRKENFLIAQWTDYDTGVRYMDYNKLNLPVVIAAYMRSPQLYPNRGEMPHQKVCENCCYRDICLRDYYEARSDAEPEEQRL